MLDINMLKRVQAIALGSVVSSQIRGESGAINSLNPDFSPNELVTMSFLTNVLSIVALGKRCLPVEVLKEDGNLNLRYYNQDDTPFNEQLSVFFASEAWASSLSENKFSIRPVVRSFLNMANLSADGSVLNDYSIAKDALDNGVEEMINSYQTKPALSLSNQMKVGL